MPPTPAALRRVLFVICDDLAWGDVSRHGNPYVRTPQLDALAAAGASCERHLSGPLCTPARAALMTGRHPYRTRAIDTYLGRSILDPDEPTLARLFADAGWRCGLFGKWHLDTDYETNKGGPKAHGFDEVIGTETKYIADGDYFFPYDKINTFTAGTAVIGKENDQRVVFGKKQDILSLCAREANLQPVGRWIFF